jgi:hypothetical protein
LKPTPIYRIAKWTETFETADSRRHKSLHWVSVPNDFTSNGYAQLVEEFGDEAAAIYGGWIALAKIASTCPVRGILSTSSGVGLSVGRLSFISHFPSSVFEKLIAWATREGVNWLEEVSSEELDRLLNDCQPVDDQSDSDSDQAVEKPQKRREKLPNERQSFGNQSPNELPNLTRPNLTGPNDTQPDPTKPVVGRSVVGREVKLNWDWTLEDLDREAQRFRKVSQLSQSGLPSKALGRLAGFGLAVGVEFLHDLALTMRHAKEPIKRPQKYVEASMRKWCEERGVEREGVVEKVERIFVAFTK